MIQKYFAVVRNIAITGLVFLVPLYVLLVIVTKAWTSLSSVSTRLAAIFGLKSIMGVGASSALSGILLVVLWLGFGLVAHISLVAAFRSRIDGWLATYIPGYSTYRLMVEEKLQGQGRTLPYLSALIKQQDFWRPVYVIEQDADGTCVLFAPNVPDTSTGTVILARRGDVLLVPSLSAAELDASLRKLGAGLASEPRIRRQIEQHEGKRGTFTSA